MFSPSQNKTKQYVPLSEFNKKIIAAYLTHCQDARWNMCTHNGLVEAMNRNNVHLVIGSTFVRYRKEIRPLHQEFVIESYICSINTRSMYVLHNIRLLQPVSSSFDIIRYDEEQCK